MAINTIFKSVGSDYERNLDGKQIVTQCNFDTTSKGGVTKVCALSSDAQITKVQALSKQIKISGRVSLKLVYLDGEGRLGSFDYISDFSEDIADDAVIADMPCLVRASIVDSVSSISGAEIKVQTVVELSPTVVEISTVELLEEGEGALALRKEQDYQRYIATVNEELEVSEEYACGARVDDVLFYDSKVLVCNVDNDDEKLTVSGQLEISVIYSSEGVQATKNINLPFVQELAARGENLRACIVANIKDSRLIIEGNENDNTLKMIICISLQGFVMQIEKTSAIVDLYSPTNALQVSKETICFDRQNGVMRFEERISGSVAVDDGDEGIKNIISSVVTQNTLSNIVAMQDCILAEGILNTCVIYMSEGGNIKCIQVELPYSLQFDKEGVASGDVLCGSVIATDCSHKVKRDREVELTANIVLSVCSKTPIENVVIKSLEEGECLEVNSSAISVYLPSKGESIWQVAKTLGMSIESIMEQNPNLNDVMQGDERIVIYREV
ncbi:MAG: DUF3794 domain-containing protein [Clostridia bacterium]|nr:DUF3794 domain-containing protein [Clostridia bacterium]